MAADPTTRLAFDSASLDRLRADAHADPRKALKGAAQQFEAIFVNMLMKSMRASLPQDGPLSSGTSRMYTEMLDQQFAQGIAARGLGLANALVKQLDRQSSVAPDAAKSAQADPAAFIERMLPHAQAAAEKTGVPAQFILGQAALESGWGAHEIRTADGAPSHNLFGVKAGREWTGKTVAALTTEHVAGVAQQLTESFRAYDSYADAFADWAQLVASSPRYAAATAVGDDAQAFARGLQAGGYATDPDYAEKLTRVLNHALLRRD